MLVKKVEKNIYNEKYLEARESVWNEKLKEYEEKKMPLWNGVVYYLDKIEGDTVYTGLCEYKDLIFLSTKSINKIYEEYNINFNFLYINVQIFIKDEKGNYLFGTKHYKDYVEIISVGGTLRLEDGNEIKKFEDIVEYAKKEITIETKIKINSNDLKYHDIIIDSGICTFLFDYSLGELSEDILNIGEFDGSVILKKEEIFDDGKFRANDRLKSLKNYL